MDKPIAVTTPTGQIGSQVVKGLLDAGKKVRVLARNPNRLGPSVADKVEIVQGSSDDVNAVKKALEGATALFWVCPPDLPGSVMDNYTHLARVAAEALRGSGVERVVTVSSGGKGLAHDAGPVSALHAMEDILDKTGIPMRHLRCGNFMENLFYQLEPLKAGRLSGPMRGDVKFPHVATSDIAAVAVKWLLSEGWTGQEGIGVQGPADLSWEDVAEILSKVLGRPVRFQQLSPETFRQNMKAHGGSEDEANEMIGTWAGVENGFYRAEPRTPETTTPTTLETWATENLKPLMQR